MAEDPYAILRNAETLAAYRRWTKAARRAGQPFLAVALIAYGFSAALFLWAVLRGQGPALFRSLFLPAEGLLILGGVCFAVAAVRISLWRWAHPAPGAVGRPGGQPTL
jgi:hypothetical protein